MHRQIEEELDTHGEQTNRSAAPASLSLSTQNKLICHLKDVRSIFRSPDHSEGLFCVDILLRINIYIEMSQ